MNKTLFKNKEEFNSFIVENTGNVPGNGIVVIWYGASEPEEYPCIAVWEIQYDGNGPDVLEYEFVYLNDFEQ